jgi:hypothetical protein
MARLPSVYEFRIGLYLIVCSIAAMVTPVSHILFREAFIIECNAITIRGPNGTDNFDSIEWNVSIN